MLIEVPDSHPRAASLRIREKLIDGFDKGLVAKAGLIAHGRGECFDYLIGEKTQPFAEKATEAACAMIILAEHPVLSINGNVAALCPEDCVTLSIVSGAPLEINLFYRTKEREDALLKHMLNHGADEVLGVGDDETVQIEELQSKRRIVSKKGIYRADVVFVPLEDGDRTEALVETGKKVITVDLNPLSRTAQKAQITIIDNIVRTIPLITEMLKNMKKLPKNTLQNILHNYDNQKTLQETLSFIMQRLKELR
ncbi:MAG TPA: phosphopantothenate/pantothenate synthetase [Candidatus Cloacimonetes bacterium]|nr:phosphopantothenate/pantothenate synthetase [Candidatus Cloacimonadota bacterium]HEX37484.1 phosphopantothenate/pantothenate synthetase [Candidatus Cloacimonadota bacterium]